VGTTAGLFTVQNQFCLNENFLKSVFGEGKKNFLHNLIHYVRLGFFSPQDVDSYTKGCLGTAEQTSKKQKVNDALKMTRTCLNL
jgi:hypothetical protein